MLTYRSNSTEPHLSLTDHVTVLLGGAVGGSAGLAFVAFWLVPGVYSIFHLDTLQCCGLGLVAGYLPGIGVCFAALQVLNRRIARLVGFLAAAASAALLSGLVATFFGAAAHV
jgi:hypothetical protein